MESHIIEEYIGWVSIPLIKIVGDTYQFSKPSTDPKLSEIEELIDEELFYSRYRKCVYNPSRLAYAYSQKGRLTYEQKKFKEAIVFFNQAIELSTVNSEAYKLISFYYRALCKFELKDMFGTISDLGNIIGKEKSYNGNLVFDWTHNSKNSFVIYGVTYPLIDKENAYLTLAAANARLKNYNKALELINIVLRNNTKSGSGYFLRAQINLTLSKRKEACKDASKAGELEINEAYEFIDKYCQ
jgi:tetratricopeptide (TPR) repeat protein